MRFVYNIMLTNESGTDSRIEIGNKIFRKFVLLLSRNIYMNRQDIEYIELSYKI